MLFALIIKILLIIGFLAFFLVYAVKDYQMGYNYVRKSPITMEVAAALGILLVGAVFIVEPLSILIETRFKKLVEVTAVLLLVCSLVACISYGIASEIVAMVITLLWLLPNSYLVYVAYRKPDIRPLSEQKGSSVLSDELPDNFSHLNNQVVYDLDKHAGRCKCCTMWSYLILLALACFLIALNSIIEAYNLKKYEVQGQLVTVRVYPISQPDGPQINLRINCVGSANGKSTFLLEHGGGSNGLAFAGVQELLSENGRRSCSYDRPGYGRSDSGPNDATPQENAQRTYDLLKNAGETGPFVVVGWSAGVEIVQVFAASFPSNVTGMAFIDGYPNYRVLEAIANNYDSSYVTSAQGSLLTLLWLIRNLEPFGTDAIIGGASTYLPEEMRDYYTAYYRNYYTWYSQYQDIKNPYDLTTYLTKLGDDAGAQRPYVGAKVDLNWPNITVPLLLMPANDTITNPSSSNYYLLQMTKYQSKATTSTMSILPGNHGIVT